MAKVFEYLVFKDEKINADGDVTEKAQVIVPVTQIVAADEKQATLVASRAIPDEHMDDLDRVQVVVRPF